MDRSWTSELGALFPAEVVTLAAADREAHAGDAWLARQLPEAVVFPRHAEDVATVLRFAQKHQLPVTARGAGRGYVGGCVPVQGGIVLAMAGLNRVLEINPLDGVAIVQPGVITGHLQAEVRRQGLFYPPDPASLKECTLGGNIATNAGGPRCLKYGVTRHYVLGLQVVLADGSLVRTGGRTQKNKTGFDLTGLFVGAEGLLGIVTEATLRLLPAPPARAVLAAAFVDIIQAAAAVQRVLASGFLPSALELADRFTLEAARRYLGDDAVPPGDAHLLLEIDGQAESVASEAAALRQLLEAAGARHVMTGHDEAAADRLWDLRREFSTSLKTTGLTKLNEDICVPRSRLVDLFNFTAHLQKKYDVAIASFGHAGDGNIHVNLMAEMSDPGVRARCDEALDELFRQVLAWGGAITGEHGIGLAKLRWWPDAVSPELRHLHQVIKTALDPHGRLNPGKFVQPLSSDQVGKVALGAPENGQSDH